MTKASAYGRVSLLGNPSDIYGGKCISFTFDKKAELELSDSNELRIHGNSTTETSLEYNGHHDLVKATLKKLGLQNRTFHISYDTTIPIGSGLAGSSAIIIATMRALNEHLSLGLDKYKIAETALRVETEELGISGGFQDRYSISFGGVTFMDFTGKEFMRETDHYGKIEHLPVSSLPFFLALGVQPKSSAIVHNPVRERWLNDENARKEIQDGMNKLAELAVKGKEVLLRGDWKKLGELMYQNTDIREELCPHLKMDKKMIEHARELGALGAKVAGSGGAVVILSEDDSVFESMSQEYPCYKPRIIQ